MVNANTNKKNTARGLKKGNRKLLLEIHPDEMKVRKAGGIALSILLSDTEKREC